ncbi:MAG: long-chain fatty acid--CoA ligase [Sulfobacillus benefaciens]|uniref:Long-chain fatty acid--CoA ligase n=1 Tax=Sulfobacillus benefaciens TaxID=453960 RepID=A0A2T2XE26_9FIRM|nr:MAG: long-chain fatty acid--CoA ligase [Sulfobacillus benefaciens]
MTNFLTTCRVLDSWVQIQPDRTAIIDATTNLGMTYQELDQASTTLASALRNLGVQAGDVIAFVINERLPVAVLLYAVGKLAASWSPLNPHSAPQDWARQLDHSHASAVVFDPSFTSLVDTIRESAATVKYWIPWIAPAVREGHTIAKHSCSARDSDYAGILYTSGTTGIPKGAWHTHQSLWGWNHSIVASIGMNRDDCLINPYPLFHMGGIGFTLAAIQTGATVVLDTPFEASHFVESVQRYKSTLTFMVPTMVQALLDLPADIRQELSQSRLRQIITTSAPLLTETRQEMARQWPQQKISVLYSATEAVFSLLRYERADARLCVGRPAFGMEVAVFDQNHQPCPPGTIGTIYTQGLSVFAHYHRAPDQFHAWQNQWFTCNDVGYLDEDGYLYLVDREKDLINSGGEKISSLEIENVLREHPWVREVAVVGIPDKYWGEQIHAVVVPSTSDLTPESILAFAAERLPRYKLPKSLRFMSSLPKTDTGKILKRSLRDSDHLDHTSS